MNQIRFTSLNMRPVAGFGQSFANGLEPESSLNAASSHGVDEFVFDPASGTFASLQQPASLSSLLNDNNRSCSFVI